MTLSTGTEIPSGGIIMWSGSVANVPQGWKLCDGTNGTPDLSGKFIIGSKTDSGGTYDVGDTGGAATDTVPAHDHGGWTGGVDHGAYGGDTTAGFLDTYHAHPISSQAAVTVDTIPPYYAMAFIMKT